MFDKIGRVAETMATRVNLSRRGFLDRLGQGALAAVGLLGGAFVLSHGVRASSTGLYCCRYVWHCRDPYGRSTHSNYACYSGGCPPGGSSYYCTIKLASQRQVSDCTQCP
jgi:hypothetical protein